MLSLFNYKTPAKFADAFKAFYAVSNLKQVRILSALLFIISVSTRVTSIVFYDEVSKFQNYASYSLLNWVQMTGTLLFFTLSSAASKFNHHKFLNKKIITLSFIIFILLVSLSISYIFSMHNTKNNLTMFLLGITTVSLFFAIPYIEITFISIFITAVFLLSIQTGTNTFEDKLLNIFAAVILGFMLHSFSRYSYYFKSQHFVRLKQLEEKNSEIERLNAQKNEILGFVAHDLRNPLNNIDALTTLLLSHHQSQKELQLILNATHHAKNIINDLIDAVRNDQNKVDTEALNLNVFLTNIIAKWRTNNARTLMLQLNSQDITSPANASKLERVLDNLISNAIKFSPIDKEITIALNKVNQHAEIEVIDHGIGIPDNLKPFIFQQFSKAGRSGLHGEKSIGLGLHISQLIVEQHGGKLNVQSEENIGTTFTLELPLS